LIALLANIAVAALGTLLAQRASVSPDATQPGDYLDPATTRP
jgi:hypothetical protein